MLFLKKCVYFYAKCVHPDLSSKSPECLKFVMPQTDNLIPLLYINLVTNKDLWYIRGNYTQYFVITYNGKNLRKNVYIKRTHFAVTLKLIQHCNWLYFNLHKDVGSLGSATTGTSVFGEPWGAIWIPGQAQWLKNPVWWLWHIETQIWSLALELHMLRGSQEIEEKESERIEKICPWIFPDSLHILLSSFFPILVKSITETLKQEKSGLQPSLKSLYAFTHKFSIFYLPTFFSYLLSIPYCLTCNFEIHFF